ncbi:hypothetical protein ACWCQQ_46405 [Streptomyces sp. NPDC002143]
MSPLDELRALLGKPARGQLNPNDWNEVEQHIGTALPRDFKMFLDAYGSGGPLRRTRCLPPAWIKPVA